ncbi:MAG: hypothetical protein WCY37_02640 [Candidatus Dojkabacteria bacterium]
MPQERKFENPKAEFIRRLTSFLVSLVLTFLAFNYGYVQGFTNVRTGIFSPIFQVHKNYLVSELERDSLVRTLPVTYSRYGSLAELDLQIVYPQSWVVIARSKPNDVQSPLEDEVMYEIKDIDSTALLKIELLNVDFSRAVMATSTDVTLTQQILDREVITYDIPEPGEETFITVYREPKSEVEVSYVQGIKSQANPSEEPKKLENFIIFNHRYDSKESSNILLTAKISLEFNENLTGAEKEKLLEITDRIVASLRLL